MRKFLLPLALCLLTAGFASASPTEVKGNLTVAFGWVKRADGTRVSVAGLSLPYVARKIEATKLDFVPGAGNQTARRKNSLRPVGLRDVVQRSLGSGGQGGSGSGSGGPEADTTIYNSNFFAYGFAEDNPSSLDDIVLSAAGQNKLWKHFSFGFNYGFANFSNFLIRWRIWQTNVDKPAGQNDFDNEFADFGVIWDQPVSQGAWYVTIDIQQAGVLTNDLSIYLAQQFRTTQLNGEGPFIYGIDTIFNNTTNPPSVGSSEDQFWYDWDPVADGIYENTEIDIFEGSRADHAHQIVSDTATITNTLLPNLATATISVIVAGDNNSLQFVADGDVLKMNPFWGGARTSPIAQFVTEANCPTATPLSLKYEIVASATTGPMNVAVELYNYAFNLWVPVGNFTVGTTPVYHSEPYGGVLPLSGFVSTTTPRKVRARVSYKNVSPAVPRTFTMDCDLFNWVVTRL